MSKIGLFLNYLSFVISKIFPKKKNRWVFGSWFGKRIADNSYSFYQYVCYTHPEIEAVWICEDLENAKKLGVNAIKKNTLKCIWFCLTARVAVMNQGYLDFGNINWIFGSYKVQLWHGVPWKKIGEDTKDEKSGFLHRISHATFLFASKCDLYISPSDETRKVIKSAFLTSDDHILNIGQPRNELLHNSKRCLKSKERLQSIIGAYDVFVLYMPTFRDKTSKVFSFVEIEDRLIPYLKKYNAVILEKQHFVDSTRNPKTPNKVFDNIINVEDMDAQFLLASSDILITDYSSCFFDFVLRDKPIIHFLYDYEDYRRNDRGMYYDLEYVLAGKDVYDTDELIDNLKNAILGEDSFSNRRNVIKNRFAKYELPDNSRVIFNHIVNNIFER